MVAYVWQIYETNVYPKQLIRDWFVISWSAKWLYDDEVFSDVLTPEEALSGDDKRIVSSMWELLESADVVVGHNSDRFDLPRLNTRFLFHGMTPPLPYRKVDTLKTLKRNFRVTSNNMNFFSSSMLNANKQETDFDMWAKCMEGDVNALAQMESYNCNDVIIQEKMYLKLLSWMDNHPNLGVYSQDGMCTNCGSTDIQFSTKKATTNQNAFVSFRCNSCYTVGRTKESLLDKSGKDLLAHTRR